MELQFVFQCWPARGIISQVYMSIQKNHCFEKPPLSQDHVRFTTQCSENMRSSWHNERVRVGTWFQIFFPQILLFTLVSHIWKAESYQGLWPGTRGNASLRAVLAIAASMPRSRSNVDEQMEKCVTRPGTEKNQKLALNLKNHIYPIPIKPRTGFEWPHPRFFSLGSYIDHYEFSRKQVNL